MNASWADFVGALAGEESGAGVARLVEKIGESPIVSETPEAFNDPLKTTYWKFLKSGVEIGFRGGVLNHVHLFAVPHEGYGLYSGEIMGHAANTWTLTSTKDRLGPATKEKQGYQDGLLGYIYPWCRYEFPGYAVRMEFLQDAALRKISIISD
ncbi:hypothetical protein [Burkholderia stagnalis]|uniref:hypothetical protein n=1 Tax=Burkholderia stagnalis TaxID=1503054 RepID=UPI0012D9F7FF|nr:hypothetical protein [Burkholderia stagnalis]